MSKPPDGFSIDPDKPKFRSFEYENGVVDYTHEGFEITVDWVNGKDFATMLNAILAVDGEGVSTVRGYVTDKLGEASDSVLIRFARRVAFELDGDWNADLRPLGRKRYLVFSREELS